MDKEVKIPVILLAVGVLAFIVYGFTASGTVGAGAILFLITVNIVFSVAFSLAGCYITAAIMKISFGYLKTAILKLAAISVLSSAVFVFIPCFGWLVSIAVSFGLLMWLFELELYEVIALTIVLIGLRLLTLYLVLWVLTGPIAAPV